MSLTKINIITIFLVILCNIALGQFTQIEKLDSFKRQMNLVKEDSLRELMMSDIAWNYHIWNPDSGVVYGQKALALATQIRFPRGEARAETKGCEGAVFTILL